MAGLGVVAGLLQAAVLLVIVRAAAAVTLETEEFEAELGPLSGGTIQTNTLIWIGFALVTCYLVIELAIGWQISWLNSTSARELRARVLRSYAAAPWHAKATSTGSTLVQYVTGNATRAATALTTTAQLLKYAGISTTLVASAFVLSPLGASFMLVTMFGLFLITLPLVRAARRQSRYASELNKAFASEVQDLTALGREIEIFGVQSASLDRANSLNLRQSNLRFRTSLVTQLSGTIFRVMALFLIVAALALLNVIGPGNAASMAAALLILLRSVSAGQAVQRNYQRIAELIPWIEQLRARFSELAAATEAGPPAIDRRATQRAAVGVRIEDLTFGYRNDHVVLDHVNADIRAGESIGVIGRSGAGKTTLGELLLGLWSPRSGAIYIDGEDLSRIARGNWTRSVAYVPQDPALIAGTLAENIRFFRPDVSDAEITDAAEAALLLGDDAPINVDLNAVTASERGLSGGQRQRVAIARALAGQPGLIVLDEPTSALDPKSEEMFSKTIQGLRGRCTTVIIAHRLSTLDHCDRILVLQDGKVVAFGPPSELGDLRAHLDNQDPLGE